MCSDNFSNYSLKLYLNLEIAKLSFTAIHETPHGWTQGKADQSYVNFVTFPQQCRESVIKISHN